LLSTAWAKKAEAANQNKDYHTANFKLDANGLLVGGLDHDLSGRRRAKSPDIGSPNRGWNDCSNVQHFVLPKFVAEHL